MVGLVNFTKPGATQAQSQGGVSKITLSMSNLRWQGGTLQPLQTSEETLALGSSVVLWLLPFFGYGWIESRGSYRISPCSVFSTSAVLFHLGCYHKVPQTLCPRHSRVILLTVGNWEAQGEGAGRFGTISSLLMDGFLLCSCHGSY